MDIGAYRVRRRQAPDFTDVQVCAAHRDGRRLSIIMTRYCYVRLRSSLPNRPVCPPVTTAGSRDRNDTRPSTLLPRAVAFPTAPARGNRGESRPAGRYYSGTYPVTHTYVIGSLRKIVTPRRSHDARGTDTCDGGTDIPQRHLSQSRRRRRRRRRTSSAVLLFRPAAPASAAQVRRVTRDSRTASECQSLANARRRRPSTTHSRTLHTHTHTHSRSRVQQLVGGTSIFGVRRRHEEANPPARVSGESNKTRNTLLLLLLLFTDQYVRGVLQSVVCLLSTHVFTVIIIFIIKSIRRLCQLPALRACPDIHVIIPMSDLTIFFLAVAPTRTYPPISITCVGTRGGQAPMTVLPTTSERFL